MRGDGSSGAQNERTREPATHVFFRAGALEHPPGITRDRASLRIVETKSLLSMALRNENWPDLVASSLDVANERSFWYARLLCVRGQ